MLHTLKFFRGWVAALAAGLLLAAGPARAQQPAPALAAAGPRALSLGQALDEALAHNRRLAVAREKVQENRYRVAEAHSKYFPQLSVNALGSYNTNKLDISIPAGAVGTYASTGPIPATDVPLVNGSHTVVLANAQVAQPLTQLAKVRTGEALARADVALAQTQVRQAEWQVRQGVERLYYGLLINEQQQRQAELGLQAARRQRYDAESARLAGQALPAQELGAEADVADQEQRLLKLQNQAADYAADLNQALGLPLDTRLALAAPAPTPEAPLPLADYLAHADTASLDNRLAAQTQAKALLGVRAAHQQYLPDLSLSANYLRFNGVPLLPKNSLLAGVQLSWNVYDFGGRRAVLGQRLSQQRQAEENQGYTRQQVATEVQQAYRQLRQATAQTTAAQKAADLRAAELKIKQDQAAAGRLLPAEVLRTQAAQAQAQADLLAAQLAYRLAPHRAAPRRRRGPVAHRGCPRAQPPPKPAPLPPAQRGGLFL